DRHTDVQGNLLLDHLLGAEVRLQPRAEWPPAQSRLDDAAADLRKVGRKPYVVPYGGSGPLGAAAYAWGYLELLDQLRGRAPGWRASSSTRSTPGRRWPPCWPQLLSCRSRSCSCTAAAHRRCSRTPRSWCATSVQAAPSKTPPATSLGQCSPS